MIRAFMSLSIRIVHSRDSDVEQLGLHDKLIEKNRDGSNETELFHEILLFLRYYSSHKIDTTFILSKTK